MCNVAGDVLCRMGQIDTDNIVVAALAAHPVKVHYPQYCLPN